MNKTIVKLLSILMLFFFSFNCGDKREYQRKDLEKVSREEMITRAKNQQFPDPKSIVFRNLEGNEISMDSLMKIGNPADYAQDYYQDKDGVIREMVIRPATTEDKKFVERMLSEVNEGPEVDIIDVDCANKAEILQGVFDRDQKRRKEKNQTDKKIDHENLEIIISFLEKCGMPTLEEVNEIQMTAIWAVLQHNSNGWRKEYMSLLEESARKGDLKWSQIAMMKDRILMEDGQPQVYGTQVSDGKLYDLVEPAFVNKRRKEMGMEPIQEYLNHWSIKFEVPQKE